MSAPAGAVLAGFASEPERGPDILRDQAAWMTRLGSETLAA